MICMERSESGSPILRHEVREREFEFAIGDSENIDRISEHIERHIGPVATVFHELISDMVHIDVHIVEPSSAHPCYTLVTSGMSDIAMSPPEGYPELRYSELFIRLPPDWNMSQDSWKAEENYWPIRLLKYLSRFPHEYQTWLWALHTIPNGNPPGPFASNTAMCGVILVPPVTIAGGFYELPIDENKTIHFHGVIPLHADEMDWKLKKGAEALFDGFEKNGVCEILNPSRASVVEKRKSWFSFLR